MEYIYKRTNYITYARASCKAKELQNCFRASFIKSTSCENNALIELNIMSRACNKVLEI